jgi:hypothetical protein
MDELTRLFFVTESNTSNQTLFETLEGANAQYNLMCNENNERHPRMYIAIVKNAYRDENDQWTYEDSHDTFQIIKYF